MKNKFLYKILAFSYSKTVFFSLVLLSPFLFKNVQKLENTANERFSLRNYTIFQPGSNVSVSLFSSSAKDEEYHFRLFKIDNPAEFYSLLNKNDLRSNFDIWGVDNQSLLRFLRKIKEWDTFIHQPKDNLSENKIDVGKFDSTGAYILQALNANQVAYCAIYVSRLALIYKVNDSQLLAFIANSESGKVIAKANFSIYNKGNLVSEQKSDNSGVVLFNFKKIGIQNESKILLIANADGETVLSDPYFTFNQSESNYRAYIYTNQPVYRPGQEVFFKAILRKQNGNILENMTNEEFEVKIKSSKGIDIYSKKITTDDFGSLYGNFTLHNDVSLGYYSIQITSRDLNFYGSFSVEEYKKPEYQVKVFTVKKNYASGDTISIGISSNYYFGSPVSNGKVSLKIYKQNYSRPWWAWSKYAWFYSGLISNSNYFFSPKELIKELSGILDQNGNIEFPYIIPAKIDGDYTYTFSAEVTDNSRSTIEGTSEVFVSRGSFLLSSSAERYFVPQGEPVGLRINAYDFSNHPVQTGFKVIVFYPEQKNLLGNSYFPFKDTLSSLTDSSGKAFVTFIPRKFYIGNYKYKVIAVDEKNREISAESSFFIGEANQYYNNYSHQNIEIVPDKDIYEKGDTINAYVLLPDSNIDALVTFETKEIIGFKIYHIKGNTFSLKEKLTGNYSPGFNLSVTYIKSNRMWQNSIRMGVLDKSKFLDVSIIPTKEIYKPGDTASYNISVKNNVGLPAKDVQLSLGVVDESIYAIKEDQTPDIKTFFYSPDYYYMPTYCNADQNYSFSTSRIATCLDKKLMFKGINPKGNGNLTGKVIVGESELNLKDITVILNNDSCFYQTNLDTSNSFSFNQIQTGEYDLLVFFNNNEIYQIGKVNIDYHGYKLIDLSKYKNNILENDFIRHNIVSFTKAGLNKSPLSQKAALIESSQFVQPNLRSEFLEAPFWKANIVTDSNGKAQIKFKLPDNLTSWRTTVKCISKNSEVGQQVNNIIVRKNLLIRIEPPRFFRQGDEVVVSTIVHNYLEKEKEVKVSFNVNGLTLIGSKINQLGYSNKLSSNELHSYKIKINKNSDVRIDWRIKVTEPAGMALLKASALTDEESDAVELKVPIHPEGIKIVEPVIFDVNGNNNENTIEFYIPKDANLKSAKFSFSAVPSLTGTMLKAIDELAGYPYGCIEQTMSRFLPTVIVDNTFKILKTPLNFETLKNLPKMVSAGLNRLYNFQHSDGGWGWWSNDNTNPYMTAYVIYGMSLASSAGFIIDSVVFNKGLENLKDQLFNNDKLNFTTKAFMLYSYLTAMRGKIDNKNLYLKMITELAKEKLNPYALSLLALSLNQLENSSLLNEVLKRLKNSAIENNNYVYWSGKQWHYAWQEDKTQTTAFVIKAFLASNVYKDLVDKAVRWILLQKQGFSWSSTQQTAIVLFALTDYLKQTKELNPDYKVSVFVNNKKLFSKEFDSLSVLTEQPTISINGFSQNILRHGDNIIKIIKHGNGKLYFSGINEFYTFNEKEAKLKPKFTITRKYYILSAENEGDKIIYTKKLLNGEIKSGEIILVETNVETEENNLQYFILEDMLPSGFEPIKDESKFVVENGNKNFISRNSIMIPLPGLIDNKEYHDDRISFFVTNVNKKMDFSYIIQSQTPGKFTADPARGYLMYYPNYYGNSKIDTILVKK
jgi:uncharacterized protein YfaS (alpha-2-macroglobulin family)